MNQIYVIKPYFYHGIWVFDDKDKGLEKEGFTAGVPEILEELVWNIPNAHKGFCLLFSAEYFPDYDIIAEKISGDKTGTWYRVGEKKGWLCPALFKYFDKAPKNLYVKAKEINDKST